MQVDILNDRWEVDEVKRFVADSARSVLGVDAAQVLAVSARTGLRAKLSASVHRSHAGGIFAGLWGVHLNRAYAM